MVIIMTILFIRRQYHALHNKRMLRKEKPDGAYSDGIMLVPLTE